MLTVVAPHPGGTYSRLPRPKVLQQVAAIVNDAPHKKRAMMLQVLKTIANS